ncbi:MAG: hypothetical protein HWE23_16005 [Rhodobacteraceae bacterium]|nr:hypothetical protein [Paracoccaceae bacterium]
MCVAALFLGGCAYSAAPVSTPAFDTALSYSDKIPGKWVLAVDLDKFSETVRPSGYACAIHSYPLDVRQSYQSALNQTLQNVFESVEVVDRPPTAEQLKEMNAKGSIFVRAEAMSGRVDVLPGFWSANMRSRVELVSAVLVDGPSGRLFGKTVEGDGEGEESAGLVCSGGAKSLAAAAEDAMKDNVRGIAETLGNAPNLRK